MTRTVQNMVLSPHQSEAKRQRGENLSPDIGNRTDRRIGLLRDRGVDADRFEAIYRSFLYGDLHTTSRDRRNRQKANGLWMAQIARNVTDEVDGFFKGKRYLIHDRDPLYTQEFLNMLSA